MHRAILGVCLLLAAGGVAAQPAAPAVSAASMPASATSTVPACPRAGAAVVERFISADCPGCWSAEDVAPAPADAWLFDWIAPTAAGSEAPLAAAASGDAADRARRAGGPAPVAHQLLIVRSTSPRTPGLRLTVQSGPAWNGYFGLRLEARGRVPAGSTAWLALVEVLPENSEGSAVERHLVRSVAGPLPLDGLRGGRATSHLRALRWPETAQPARLQPRGWIEAPDGALLAVATDRCPLK